MTRTMTTTTEKTPGMADYEKRIREALGRELTGEKWESDGAGVYSVEDSDFEVAVCFTQDADDAAYIAACDPSAIRALLAELDAVRGALLKIANDCDTGEHTDIARTTLAQQAQEPVAWHTFDGEPDHTLKTDPDAFDAVAAGIKTYEIRKDDRGYKVGDKLLLKRTRYTGNQMFMRPAHCPLEYTGEEARRVVSHIQRGYGLGDDWVILSFATTPQPQPASAPVIDAVCCNGDCTWGGPMSDCRMLGTVGPLCPDCGETVEPCGSPNPAPQAGDVAPEFIADLERSRAKYPNNARMFDGLMGEVDELRLAYSGDGDIRAEAFDVAVCAYRIATEGDAGWNTRLSAPQAGEVTDEQIDDAISAAISFYTTRKSRPDARAEICAILALRPQAESSEWQPVTEDDLTAFEKFITERSQNAPFIPADANTLANATMHMNREVRAARALRPAAQPMTPDEALALITKASGRQNPPPSFYLVLRNTEAFHGITAQGAQGEQA